MGYIIMPEVSMAIRLRLYMFSEIYIAKKKTSEHIFVTEIGLLISERYHDHLRICLSFHP